MYFPLEKCPPHWWSDFLAAYSTLLWEQIGSEGPHRLYCLQLLEQTSFFSNTFLNRDTKLDAKKKKEERKKGNLT